MDTADSSNTLNTSLMTVYCHIAENCNPHTHCCKNLKSLNFYAILKVIWLHEGRLSPVTVTHWTWATCNCATVGAVSGFNAFCIIRRPRNSKSFSNCNNVKKDTPESKTHINTHVRDWVHEILLCYTHIMFKSHQCHSHFLLWKKHHILMIFCCFHGIGVSSFMVKQQTSDPVYIFCAFILHN